VKKIVENRRFRSTCVADRRTDGQTDRILIARPRMHFMLHHNKHTKCINLYVFF